MDEQTLKAQFKQQVHMIVERSRLQPDGFVAYFANREPKDEEIFGLIAISAMASGEFKVTGEFPTPVEALAALSRTSRAEICEEFRKELKTFSRQLTAA